MELSTSAAILLIVTPVLHLLAAIAMMAAFGWPGNLGFAAEKNFREVVIPFHSVSMFGYTTYGIYSVLIAPMVSVTVDALRQGKDSPLLEAARGFGVLSTMARMIGLTRWILAMPGLALKYTAPNADTELKRAIEAIYDMLNSFCGGIGEGLGVSVFCSVFIILISVYLLRDSNSGGRYPVWLAYFGMLTAVIVFLPVIELYGVDMGPYLVIAVVFNMAWYIAFGIVMLGKCQKAEGNINLGQVAMSPKESDQ